MTRRQKDHHAHIISTGGTIEKSFNEQTGTLSSSETLLQEFINTQLRLPQTEISLHPLMLKDSLELSESDRRQIIALVRILQEQNTPVIVVHGTDTMITTARLCQKEIPNPKVPIIFTGAMRPIGVGISDARQNLAEALLASRLLEPAVHIVFHSQILRPEQTTKNYTTLTFEQMSTTPPDTKI